jgi:hypothetical protein
LGFFIEFGIAPGIAHRPLGGAIGSAHTSRVGRYSVTDAALDRSAGHVRSGSVERMDRCTKCTATRRCRGEQHAGTDVAETKEDHPITPVEDGAILPAFLGVSRNDRPISVEGNTTNTALCSTFAAKPAERNGLSGHPPQRPRSGPDDEFFFVVSRRAEPVGGRSR